MEAQIALRVMADVIDDGSVFLSMTLVPVMVKNSGISKN